MLMKQRSILLDCPDAPANKRHVARAQQWLGGGAGRRHMEAMIGRLVNLTDEIEKAAKGLRTALALLPDAMQRRRTTEFYQEDLFDELRRLERQVRIWRLASTGAKRHNRNHRRDVIAVDLIVFWGSFGLVRRSTGGTGPLPRFLIAVTGSLGMRLTPSAAEALIKKFRKVMLEGENESWTPDQLGRFKRGLLEASFVEQWATVASRLPPWAPGMV